jgi:hypothetical protein
VLRLGVKIRRVRGLRGDRVIRIGSWTMGFNDISPTALADVLGREQVMDIGL